MPIVAADLKLFGAANHAEDDSSTQGGAIDLTCKLELGVLAANDVIEMVSSDAGDTTPTVRLTARTAAGVIYQDTKTLNGTTAVDFTGTAERILKVDVMSGTPNGTITIRRDAGGTTLCTLEPGITKVKTLGYNVKSSTSAAKSVYEKGFYKNTHGTISLTTASITLTTEAAEPADTLIAVETSVNGTGTSTNRVTAPSGVGTFRQLNVAEPLPGDQNLDAGEAIAFWIQHDLAQSEPPFKDDVAVKLDGSTT